MDFMVAAANFTGVVANFDKYLVDETHKIYSEQEYNITQDYMSCTGIIWDVRYTLFHPLDNCHSSICLLGGHG